MKEWTYENENIKLFSGDVFDCLKNIESDTIQSTITSPTYWGKRSFTNSPKEFGKETLEEFVDKNVKLYAEILNKMKETGSLFIIIQDSYMGSGISRTHHNHWETNMDPSFKRDGLDCKKQGNTSCVTAHHKIIKNKSLCGIPYRIALRLVDMGYIWREQIIWEKPNVMPENVKDRAWQSSEYVLHFTKNRIYTFNKDAIMIKGKSGKQRLPNQVWVIPTEPKRGHTATFSTKLVEKLLLATTDEGDTVFEPFLGSGTMMDLSIKHNRKFIGADINKTFIDMAIKRIRGISQ